MIQRRSGRAIAHHDSIRARTPWARPVDDKPAATRQSHRCEYDDGLVAAVLAVDPLQVKTVLDELTGTGAERRVRSTASETTGSSLGVLGGAQGRPGSNPT